jgi:orotate phosphoribosyltransferase
MSLFRLGDFTLASGQPSRWKIECDALTAEDWDALAAISAEILPPFGVVEGVPRGGWPFADALRKYSRACSCSFRHPPHDWCLGEPLPALIADDVWTTGTSVRRFIGSAACPKPVCFQPGACVVAFARGPVPPWVTPLFRMPRRADQ